MSYDKRKQHSEVNTPPYFFSECKKGFVTPGPGFKAVTFATKSLLTVPSDTSTSKRFLLKATKQSGSERRLKVKLTNTYCHDPRLAGTTEKSPVIVVRPDALNVKIVAWWKKIIM